MALSSVKIYKLLRDHAGIINKMAADLGNDALEKTEAAKQATEKAKELIAELKK